VATFARMRPVAFRGTVHSVHQLHRSDQLATLLHCHGHSTNQMEDPMDHSPTLPQISRACGLEMPEDFPSVPYNAIHQRCMPVLSDPMYAGQRDEFSSSWNAVAYRFRSLAHHDQLFTEAIANQATHETRYVQEREIFCFFVAGLSTLESFSYGVYHIASIAQPNAFSLSDPRAITFQKVRDSFGKAFEFESITKRLSALSNDLRFKEWREVRNTLAHRGAPGRSIELSIGDSGPPRNDVWRLKNIELNEKTTEPYRKWLADWLVDLMDDALVFVEKTFQA